ncbi:MAG: hypothetical protein ABI165_10070 [Bryobacteraceae bacterium]
MRAVLLTILVAGALGRAQGPAHIDYKCADDDIEFFGLNCTPEMPCPVYLELTSLERVGAKLFLTGNFHSATVTLDSILLMSADEGKTWTEPHARIRSASLDQAQFVDLEKGWVSGETVQSLPRNPFFLVTTDAGLTWDQRPVFEEDRVGTIVQFWFDSPTSGSVVIEAGSKNERYETMTGGSTWAVREVKDSPIRLKQSYAAPNPDWRLRADAASQTYRVEKRQNGAWRTLTSFPIHVADCKPAEAAPSAPTPGVETPAPVEAPRKPPSPRKAPSEGPLPKANEQP